MLRNTHRRALPGVALLEASMRPKRNASEYILESVDFSNGVLASMRPKRNASEYNWSKFYSYVSRQASMRPKRNASEYRKVKQTFYPATI